MTGDRFGIERSTIQTEFLQCSHLFLQLQNLSIQWESQFLLLSNLRKPLL